MLHHMCTRTRGARLALDWPVVLAAAAFFITVMTGYIWKSENSHKAEPQSKRRRDMLRQYYERLAPFEEQTAASPKELHEMLGIL